MNEGAKFDRESAGRWYDLFSRGARDWLRHNDKVREAVRERLPELMSEADIIESDGDRRVQVPVRFLEHYRFRLADSDENTGVGQGGDASPGDVIRPGDRRQGRGKGAGGAEGGGLRFVLELSVDDIVDWLWEELRLPDLKAKAGAMKDDDYVREGWDRRGARSRLDRRRSLKESIKRRAIQPEGPLFTDDDLRYRQLVKRESPAFEAVVFFVMDVSASMTQRDRQLAKTFFFWVVQGLRRQYSHLEIVFVAHTEKAWEFSEQEFFQVKGLGGTVSSTAFKTVLSRIDEKYSPSRYNIYAFYASDGQNFADDREASRQALAAIGKRVNFMGFVEVSTLESMSGRTEMTRLFQQMVRAGAPFDVYQLREEAGVWDGIRRFFREQAEEAV